MQVQQVAILSYSSEYYKRPLQLATASAKLTQKTVKYHIEIAPLMSRGSRIVVYQHEQSGELSIVKCVNRLLSNTVHVCHVRLRSESTDFERGLTLSAKLRLNMTSDSFLELIGPRYLNMLKAFLMIGYNYLELTLIA